MSEKQVITSATRDSLKGYLDGPTNKYDLSIVDVGDWFIAKGKRQFRGAKQQIGKLKKQIDCEFKVEPHGRISYKFTRIE